jgi:hypothetical protein
VTSATSGLGGSIDSQSLRPFDVLGASGEPPSVLIAGIGPSQATDVVHRQRWIDGFTMIRASGEFEIGVIGAVMGTHTPR